MSLTISPFSESFLINKEQYNKDSRVKTRHKKSQESKANLNVHVTHIRSKRWIDFDTVQIV